MTLRLFDTLSRSLRDFEPVEPGRASIYLCGATVQSPPHIGHIRSGLNFDIIGRWLSYRGYRVTFIRNVTDIDDKILARSAEAGIPWWAWAAANERAFTDAYDLLGCGRPTLEPRATGHVTEMVTLMGDLIERGHAYAAGGDVYFDVRSYSAYGRLSGQVLERMQAAGDSLGDDRKRDVRDFALWKSARPGEPSWPTPWGAGRPGWHLECSAMASTYLGPEFDIHGGGLDLIFPHHENEIAQSVGAGSAFARYWMHNAWVTAAGEKMSKSLGNGLLVSELVQRVRPVELRYYLGTPHYRSVIEFSPAALAEAGAGYRRIENFVARAVELAVPATASATDGAGPGGPGPDPTGVPDAFAAAMDDDFGVPAALGTLHDTVRAGNAALAADDKAGVQAALAQVVAMTEVLGLNPLRWSDPAGPELTGAVDALIRVVTDQRQDARRRQDFATADRIRDELTAAGIIVEDTAQGPRWTVSGSVPPPAPPVRAGPGRPGISDGRQFLAARRGPQGQEGPGGRLGGQPRRALTGKGPTPRAEERTGHPAARRAGAAARREDARDGTGGRDQSRRRPRTPDAPELLVGRNPVAEALRTRIPATALYVALGIDSDERVAEAVHLAGDRLLPLLEVSRAEMDRMTGGLLHQGIALKVPAFTYTEMPDLLELVRTGPQAPLLVALDGVTDPRNLGAVIRSALAFGAQGVIVPERRAASVTATTWRTSAGAAARMPVAKVTNLVRSLKECQKAGMVVVGLDADGATSLGELDQATEAMLVVVGSEGRGLSRLVGETCDLRVHIPMAAEAESLNASVAAAVTLAEIARRRR